MKVLVVGGGYVGLATINLLKGCELYLYDIGQPNQELINSCDDLEFTLVDEINESQYDLMVICTPTPSVNGRLDTSSVEYYINAFVSIKKVVRSTVPIGFCERNGVDFWPEFLTENNPFEKSRMVYGGQSPFDFDVQSVSATEAECIKLFSNAYLSLRLTFFKEVMEIAKKNDLNFDNIREGLITDPRISELYSSPPYIVQGKCLPKDLSDVVS